VATANDLLFGGIGQDSLYGDNGDDTLAGGDDNDALLGDAGADTLFGGYGTDELQGGDGNDCLLGEAGDDKLFGQTSDDVLWGGDGNDILVGFTASNETKQTLNPGESDNDILYGGAGDDGLYGGLGSDSLDGGVDNDYLNGGDGADTLFGGTGNDELQGGYGNDRLLGEAGDDKLFGQTGDDALWGSDGNDILVGFTASNEAKQTLNAGETDNDTLFGGTGGDNLYGGLGDDYLDGGVDNDLLSGNEGADTLWGGTGKDELQGGDGNDRLLGEAGDDKLFGQTGDDALWGGDGNDILVGFTASNEAKQTLNAGESDNDILSGGAGNDFILGGLGNDTLWGEADNDELQGGAGADSLYGEVGEDRLFGQVGDDVLYGGDGDDILVGFTGYNELKQTLDPGESDNDWLYGGAGSDLLLGGLGNDYLDGGAGADIMEGGAEDDTYIVNSVNDSILERAGEGYDTVVSSSNYILNNEIEELRLLEGFNINGTGNARDNMITGNSANNILDGVTGADSMIGRGGDDTYYVDNTGDVVIEQAGEGVDTVQSSIGYTLGNNVENLILLDFSMPEKGLVDGQASLVYGFPKRNELDYMQGDAIPDYQGTCALTAIANLLTQANKPASEGEVVQVAIDNHWAVTDPDRPAWERGGSNYLGQQALLDSFGIRNKLLAGYNEAGIANLIRSGRGVIIALDAGVLWDDPTYSNGGVVNHVVTVTGVVYGEEDGALLGFYIADSGRHKVTDMTRFIDIATFREAANVSCAYAIYTTEPIKQWDEDINGTGNGADNIIVGNRGDNILSGEGGADTLNGGAGNDTLTGGAGDDTYVVDNVSDTITENAGEGMDTVYAAADCTLSANVEKLALTGSRNLSGTGNDLDNQITGNAGNNILDGDAGADTLIGGTGDDTYVVDHVFDTVSENADEGTDTVQAGITYTLGNNVENLTLTGDSALNGTGNALNNVLVGNSAANTLSGGTGVDTMLGGLGNDIYVVDNPGDIVVENEGEGTDIVKSGITYTLGANVEKLALTGTSALNGTGNALDNLLVGNSVANVLIGETGNDSLNGGAGADVMLGGLGNDVYVVDEIGDIVIENAGEGTDTVQSGLTYTLGANVERLILTGTSALNGTGNALDNILTGNSAANVLMGEAGNDSLNGGAGADVMLGGLGNDTYIVDDPGDIVIENAGEGTDTVQSGITYTLGANVEKLALTGTSALNGTGNALDNLLVGNSVANVLIGETGNDSLNGGAGADTMLGGLGNDVYVVDDIGDIVIENAGEGTDTVQSGITYTLGANVERLTLTGTSALDGTGNTLSNILTGNSVANVLTSGAGNDILNGGAGADTMFGGVGNDVYWIDDIEDIVIENVNEGTDTVQSGITYTLAANAENLTLTGTSTLDGLGNTMNNILTGNSAANTLTGEAGNDLLAGGVGNDTLIGGAGNDSFLFDTVLDAITNKDTLADFVSGQDIIKLDKDIFASLAVEGALSAANFNSSATGAAADTNDYLLHNITSGALLYDADGSGPGAAVQFASLANNPQITVSDFLVVA